MIQFIIRSMLQVFVPFIQDCTKRHCHHRDFIVDQDFIGQPP
jgi:hypothetical protein